MVTDPIADMLTRIRNANTALHDRVVMPTSGEKREIARILQQEGYIVAWAEEAAEPRPRWPRNCHHVHLDRSLHRRGSAKARRRR
jgi:ribosomal protein S8